MIYCLQNGRLGNHLFIYFFGKILSEITKKPVYYNFTLPDEFGINVPKFTKNLNNSNYIKITEKEYIQSINDWPLLIEGNIVERDLNLILEKVRNIDSPIILDGYFQKIEYYKDYHDLIKLEVNYPKQKIKEKTLGIHIRKGDITNSISDLPDIWFLDMVKKFDGYKIYITTDSPDDNVVKELINLGCELYSNTPAQTIIDFSFFSDLILSQGTFSWWMGFLSEGKKHMIIPESGWNCVKYRNSINLLINENNWLYYKLINGGVEKVEYV